MYMVIVEAVNSVCEVGRMDINQINKYVVSHLPISSEEKEETGQWYINLITAMKNEKIVQAGHMKAVQEVVANMLLIHEQLLTKDDAYCSIYKDAREDLSSFRTLAGENFDDIQICLNAVYGLLILRLNDRPVDASQKKVWSRLGPFFRM